MDVLNAVFLELQKIVHTLLFLKKKRSPLTPQDLFTNINYINYKWLYSHVSKLLFFTDTDLHNVIKKGNILKDIHKRYIMYQVMISFFTERIIILYRTLLKKQNVASKTVLFWFGLPFGHDVGTFAGHPKLSMFLQFMLPQKQNLLSWCFLSLKIFLIVWRFRRKFSFTVMPIQ